MVSNIITENVSNVKIIFLCHIVDSNEDLIDYAYSLSNQLKNLDFNAGPVSYEKNRSRPETEELLRAAFPQQCQTLRSLYSTGDGNCLSE